MNGQIHIHNFGDYIAIHTDVDAPDIFGTFLSLAIDEYVVRFADRDDARRDILAEILTQERGRRASTGQPTKAA